MIVDNFGRVYLESNELFEALYCGKISNTENLYTDNETSLLFNQSKKINGDDVSNFSNIENNNISLDQFDEQNQNNWFMPKNYKDFDIENYIRQKCNTETEKLRIEKELELFQKYNMINLLRYLKYLVETMKENNIVWGVGRGSSVASYTLFLLGVHKIDSIKYDLDINEFLK